MPGCFIGLNCNLGQNVFIDTGVKIGNNVKVQNNVSIYAGVTLQDNVFIGPAVVFTNVINPRSFIDRKHAIKNTIVKKGTTIGANATIICGNDLGEYCMIGAGSIVTRPIKAFALIMGNPARQTGWISEYGLKLTFFNGKATCPGNGDKYILSNEKVFKIIV